MLAGRLAEDDYDEMMPLQPNTTGLGAINASPLQRPTNPASPPRSGQMRSGGNSWRAAFKDMLRQKAS